MARYSIDLFLITGETRRASFERGGASWSSKPAGDAAVRGCETPQELTPS